MIRGSCLCGQVAVDITGQIEAVIHCHCSKCRKSSGSAYSTNGFVAKTDFAVTKGAQQLGRYETAPGKIRYFCRTCASPIYSTSETTPNFIRLRLGILDTDIDARPTSHNFITSKANWEELNAPLPCYEEHEPDRARFKQ